MFRSPHGSSRPNHGNKPSSRHGPRGRGGQFISTIPAAPALTTEKIDALVETVSYGDLHDLLGDRMAATHLVGHLDNMITKAKQAVVAGNIGAVEIPLIRLGFRDYARAVMVSLPLLRTVGIRMPSSGMSRPVQRALGDIAVELLPAIVVHANPICGLMGVIVPLPKEYTS